VLARKKQREFATKAKMAPGGAGMVKSGYAGLSSAEIVSQSIVRERGAGAPNPGFDQDQIGSAFAPGARGGMGGPKVTMDHFASYMEFPSGGKHTFFEKNGGATFVDPGLEQIDIPQIYDKYPGLRELYHTGPQHAFFLVKFWVDLHYDILPHNSTSFMGMDSVFESLDGHTVEVISSVISLGKQVAEKVQVLQPEPKPEEGRYIYRVPRAPMCDYLMQFVHKLREQSTVESMNRVLENFTSVVLVRDRMTTEILFCAAFAFEVTPPGYGPRSSVYKLVDSQIDGMEAVSVGSE
jgi:transcriptional enhancer factor